MTTLICIHQKDNMNNLLAIKHYEPDNIILIHEPGDDKALIQQFITYLSNQDYTIDTLTLKLKENSDPAYLPKKLSHLLQSAKNETVFLLPASRQIIGYNLFSFLDKEDVKLCFVEEDGDIWEKENSGFHFVGDATNIDVNDYILSRGGLITSDTTNLFTHERIVNLLNFIEANFKDYVSLFRNQHSGGSFYKSYPDNKNKLILFPNQLNQGNQSILWKFLNFMVDQDIIRIHQKLKSQVIINFKHKSYKSYLLKTGTWLEHRCFVLMNEVGCDDVEASLSFLWDKKRKANNEIDVIGIKDNQLYVVSCKDRSHIEPEFINELYSNAVHLGNEAAVKILFTTAAPTRGIIDKANEFGVHIITYSFDTDKTLDQFLKIVSLNLKP